ncbi:unnamed protein product, partial [Prorocentrum cordatum]
RSDLRGQPSDLRRHGPGLLPAEPAPSGGRRQDVAPRASGRGLSVLVARRSLCIARQARTAGYARGEGHQGPEAGHERCGLPAGYSQGRHRWQALASLQDRGVQAGSREQGEDRALDVCVPDGLHGQQAQETRDEIHHPPSHRAGAGPRRADAAGGGHSARAPAGSHRGPAARPAG